MGGAPVDGAGLRSDGAWSGLSVADGPEEKGAGPEANGRGLEAEGVASKRK